MNESYVESKWSYIEWRIYTPCLESLAFKDRMALNVRQVQHNGPDWF